ncbi:hypothetical protein CONLIGDRAFT_682778 [Coniochaeta ligniaria NRRL 30616]|uniref:Uncharacterized protein n=1 Tax=Coniochaeta ligniaria NRRL 30616 TaxID=1408157 RepID=A0A1J7JES6_9PEZI|nr:hypothetical protein CONLIGDRAFT_682778 [Coniochaeta ligniaria NRRL 30616]
MYTGGLMPPPPVPGWMPPPPMPGWMPPPPMPGWMPPPPMGGWMPPHPMGGWVPPPPPHPSFYNPFWPYPVPGLPANHLIWRWLATIDGGVWEDATVIPEGIGTPFKTKIVNYQRVVIPEGDEEGDDPATFGLYPPAGLRAPTVVTLPSDYSGSPPPTISPQRISKRSSTESPKESPEQNPKESPEQSPEVGRCYKAEENMAFQDFSEPLSPIRGNFIQVSTPVTTPSPATNTIHQGQSLSPIHETITESDEDDLEKLIKRGKMQYQRARDEYQQVASTPSRRGADRDDHSSSRRSRSRSPAKYGKCATPSSRSRSSSPVKSSTRRGPRNGQPRVSFTFEDSDDNDMGTAVNSPSVSTKRDSYAVSPCSPASSLSRRRHMPDLEPIDISVTRQEARAEALRKGHIPIAMHVPQKDAPEIQHRSELRVKPTFVGDDSSSAYSQDRDHGVGRLSVDPLRVNNRPPNNRVDLSRRSIFDTYTEWKEGADKRASGPQPADDEESVFEPDYHVQMKVMEMPSRKKATLVSKPEQVGYNGDPYSPLDVMFPEIAAAAARKVSTKTMIGEKGWLENTSVSPQKPLPPKSNGFFENLRKKAKELVNMGSEQLKAPRHMNKSKVDLRERQLVISLDPREQSLVYCELEFILTSAVNSYITCQFNAGRLDTDKLKRISDGWQQRGRPKVVGFRYDLETQLDLVRMHVDDFRFYSRHTTEAAIYGIIDMMRVNARVMRVRTYCQPDTVISKQILDTQSLLNIIGAGEDDHVALASVTRFYKDALAREKVFHYDAGETLSDSARLRNADQQWHQSREDGRVKTPQSGSRNVEYPRHQSREDGRAKTPQSGSRNVDYPPRHQSRENSSVATPRSRRSNRDHGESPATPWPSVNDRYT